MNREELEELIDDCTYDNYGMFPSYDELVSYAQPTRRIAVVIDKSMYDNICEDKWMSVYGKGTINEHGHKSKGDYTK